MKLFASILVCVIAALVFLALAGCNGNGEVIPVIELLPPTNIRALSKDTSVQLIWAASTFQSDPSFRNYRIITTGATARIDSTTNPANANTIIIPGLTNGTVDTFTIFTVRNDGAISAGKSIIWGPTVRYMHRRIYEIDSPEPSGLSLKTGIAVSFVVDNQDSIDLWIDGQGNTQPVLKSPSLATASSGWRTTLLAQQAGTGLDQYYPIPDQSLFTNTSLDISNTSVYYAITQDGNYARFVIPNGIQGLTPNRYVDIDIAYNSIPGKAWAKR